MLQEKRKQFAAILLAAGGAAFLAGCESSGSYRVASVGAYPGGGTAADPAEGATAGGGGGGQVADNGAGTGTGTGAGGGTPGASGPGRGPAGNLLVTAGNVVHRVGAKHSVLAGTVNGIAPGAAPVTGTVSGVIDGAARTLVDLGNGNSVILNGVGGKLGEVVKLDLGRGTVVGAAQGSPLLGVGVLSPVTPDGRVASVGVGSGGKTATVAVEGLTQPGGPVAAVAQPVTGVVQPVVGVVQPVKTIVGGAVQPVKGVVTGATGKLGQTGLLPRR